MPYKVVTVDSGTRQYYLLDATEDVQAPGVFEQNKVFDVEKLAPRAEARDSFPSVREALAEFGYEPVLQGWFVKNIEKVLSSASDLKGNYETRDFPLFNFERSAIWNVPDRLADIRKNLTDKSYSLFCVILPDGQPQVVKEYRKDQRHVGLLMRIKRLPSDPANLDVFRS